MIRDALSIQHDYARRTARSLKVAFDYTNGVPLLDIQIETGLAIGSILRIARLHGCPKRRPGLSQTVRNGVAKDYKARKLMREITAKWGVDRKTIWVICRDKKIPLRRPELLRKRDKRRKKK